MGINFHPSSERIVVAGDSNYINNTPLTNSISTRTKFRQLTPENRQFLSSLGFKIVGRRRRRRNRVKTSEEEI